MAVGRMARPKPILQTQQLPLARGQIRQPSFVEAIMGIDLEDQRIFAVVSEQRMAIGVRLVGATTVPALAIEDQDTPGRRNQLKDMFHLHL